MFSRSYKQDATSVPSWLSEKLCIFGVVLTPCQGKLFALCDRCAVLNNSARLVGLTTYRDRIFVMEPG